MAQLSSRANSISSPATHHVLTDHARLRMSQRGIRPADLANALHFGRRLYAQGAQFCVVGRKEVRHYARQGIDLRHLENMQILLSPQNNSVITVYRNARLPR